jgi:diaminopimelate epimerase
MNVEFVAPAADGLVLRVWERGAGLTEACGTGAYAAAVAARAWGLVGEDAVVHMPGGDVEVRGSTLGGPAMFVADIEVPWP